jgi:hypothetical protein
MNQYYTRGIVWQLRIVCFAPQGVRDPSRGPLHRGRYTPIAGLLDSGCCAHDDGITGLLTAAGFGVRMSGPPAKRARRSIPVECGDKVKLDESQDHFICLEYQDVRSRRSWARSRRSSWLLGTHRFAMWNHSCRALTGDFAWVQGGGQSLECGRHHCRGDANHRGDDPPKYPGLEGGDGG